MGSWNSALLIYFIHRKITYKGHFLEFHFLFAAAFLLLLHLGSTWLKTEQECGGSSSAHAGATCGSRTPSFPFPRAGCARGELREAAGPGPGRSARRSHTASRPLPPGRPPPAPLSRASGPALTAGLPREGGQAAPDGPQRRALRHPAQPGPAPEEEEEAPRLRPPPPARPPLPLPPQGNESLSAVHEWVAQLNRSWVTNGHILLKQFKTRSTNEYRVKNSSWWEPHSAKKPNKRLFFSQIIKKKKSTF